MNLYKRPLFMQQGGMARVPVPTPPAAMRPAAAPQGAMPPMRPATAPMGPMGLPRAPAAAPAARPTDQAAGIASMVSDKAKADLAQAQGPEQIINAFRGNQKPIQARYQELAEYVGPQDATATPISVLTMVQPSLMMTAKGASESGIGELMAGIAGRVPMESAPGAPNRMGQGLGNIMMSRQAPQPAGMAQGGVVGKFAEGGSSLKDYYDEDLATFQEIMAPTQADRDASKRQLFFDIAQRGLAMAGGAGGSGNVASQLANVFQTLPGTYAAQQAELRKGEQGARNAALQSAAGRVGADREQEAKIAAKRAEMEEEYRLKGLEMNQKFIYDMTVEEAKARNKGIDFKGVMAVDSNGVPIRGGEIFNVNDPEDAIRMRRFRESYGGEGITFTDIPKFSDIASNNLDYEALQVVDSDGTQLDILNQNSPTFDAELANLMTNNPGARVVKMPSFSDVFPQDLKPLPYKAVSVVGPDGTQLDILNQNSPTFEQDLANLRTTNPGAQVAEMPSFSDVSPSEDGLPTLSNPEMEGVFADFDLRTALSEGTVSGSQLTLINAAINKKTTPRSVPTGEISDNGVRVMELRSDPLPDEWLEAINKAVELGVPVQRANTSGIDSGSTRNVSPSPSISNEQAIVDDIPEITDSAFVDWNPADSFGSQAQADSFLNSAIPKVVNFFTGSEFGAGSREEIKAEENIKALNAFILQTLFSAASGNSGEKLGADERKTFSDLIPDMGTPADRAAGQYEAIVNEFNNLIQQKEFQLSNPQGSFRDVERIKAQINALKNRSAQVQGLVNALRSGRNSRANTPADLRSMESLYIKGPPVTGDQQ